MVERVNPLEEWRVYLHKRAFFFTDIQRWSLCGERGKCMIHVKRWWDE